MKLTLTNTNGQTIDLEVDEQGISFALEEDATLKLDVQETTVIVRLVWSEPVDPAPGG